MDLNPVLFGSKAKSWPLKGRAEAEGLCSPSSCKGHGGTDKTQSSI